MIDQHKRRLDHNPFPEVVPELNQKRKDAREAGLLSTHEHEHVQVREFSAPTFYIIPKVQKNLQNPPGRPIGSACRGPLERIGGYLDSFLKDMVRNL